MGKGPDTKIVSREQAYTAWASKMDAVLETTKPEVEE